MPDPVDLVKASEPAAKADVTYDLGTKFAAATTRTQRARLCFSYNTEDEISEGIARLADVLSGMGYL